MPKNCMLVQLISTISTEQSIGVTLGLKVWCVFVIMNKYTNMYCYTCKKVLLAETHNVLCITRHCISTLLESEWDLRFET